MHPLNKELNWSHYALVVAPLCNENEWSYNSRPTRSASGKDFLNRRFSMGGEDYVDRKKNDCERDKIWLTIFHRF